jgi:lipopolysaccharide transport system permease protein
MTNQHTSDKEWDLIIESKANLLKINFKEIWQYRDLLTILVKKDFVTFYKQTILGPLWFFIQPLLTTLMFTVVFGNIAKISTDGKPQILFYLSGTILWTYFADALTQTASTFTTNAGLFGKVYFPRIIMPLSKVVSNILKFGIQLILLIGTCGYVCMTRQISLDLNWQITLLPLYLLIMMLLGLGLGMMVAALTTKYKDLTFVMSFGVQLLMYATPVIYPLSSVVNSPYYLYIKYNPISPVIECFRQSMLGGVFDPIMLIYSFVISIVLFFIGLIMFNYIEKTFIDTI